MRKHAHLLIAGLALSGCLSGGGEETVPAEPQAEAIRQQDEVADRGLLGEMKTAAVGAAGQLAGTYGGAAAHSGAYDGRTREPGSGTSARYYDNSLMPGSGTSARYYDNSLMPGSGTSARYYDNSLMPGRGDRGE